ncbi:hypothetical protein PV10_07787 [Exophiala mesophila]|uniref:Amidohydrolase-related domain-containing protein n=1 Tax=Exophiala mesophila TaxID=212818 RepID=A0A0D1WN68_EXOME|nr:uncharacterized protein PV10_07787 [Exophiala mesophila]KIV90485.1 hypothetical protein PV10_07787 [Exophiala mesophila]
MDTSILLKGGVAVIHDEKDQAIPSRLDVLVRGNKIYQISEDIDPSPGTQIIDCKNKIIAPGFIDTHRHMYTIGLRGRHGDNLLEDYMVEGILQASSFDPSEIFWGQLAGCVEAINAGTTTVVDHSHLNYSPDHPKAALSATVSSGLRSIYGYCFNIRVASWAPFATYPEFIAPWALETLRDLSEKVPLGNGRVSLGVAFDAWFLPKESISTLFDDIRQMGIKYLTTHNSPGRPGVPSSISKMKDCGVLDSAILSHANMLSEADVGLIKQHNAHVSSTPSIELQMGMGVPACFDHDRDLQGSSSLGIDCHNATLASVPAEMRAALQTSRGLYNEKFLKHGKKPARVYKTVQEAYALGTIAGARAIGMENQVGSLAVGKLADIIVLDGLSPNMICGAQQDPVTAIVMHSTPADVVMTMIDGIVRKQSGRLEPIHTIDSGLDWSPGTSNSTLKWSELAEKVLETRSTLQTKIDRIDLAAAKPAVLKAFGYSPDRIVESI